MEWATKALLTAAAVALAILAAGRFKRAIGGALAGLPIVTAPWLVGLAVGRGADVAAQAATASVAACAVLAAFASGYAWAARRSGTSGATVVALMSATAIAPLAAIASVRLDLSFAVATVGCTVAWLTWPAFAIRREDRRAGIELPFVAASAGVVGASSGAAAAWLGGFGASLFAALPVVGFATALIEHRTGGSAAVSQCLRGYLGGLYGRIAFGFVFAVTVVPWGTIASLACATAAGCAATFIVVRSAAIEPGSTPMRID